MKISPINLNVSRTNFKGEYVNHISNENDLRAQKQWHKHSSVTKTLDEFHIDQKYNAYFAYPLEEVSPSIKEKVDYVVHDNEPGYPKLEDIKENYLGKKRVNYRDEFEEQRQYFYRREMGGFADVNEAKYHQWQAAKCIGLYDEAGDLRYQKEKAEDEITKLQNHKSNLEEGLASTRSEMDAQRGLKSKLNKEIKALEAIKESYQNIQTVAESNTKNETDMYKNADNRMVRGGQVPHMVEEAKYNGSTRNFVDLYDAENSNAKTIDIKAQTEASIAKINSTIERLTNIQSNCSAKIKEMKAYTETLLGKIEDTENSIKANENLVETCKSKLEPLFKKMANFYKKNNIKVRG